MATKAKLTEAEYYRQQGDRLRNARKAVRPVMTQAGLAKLAGCSRGTISKIENGEGYSKPHLYATMLHLLTDTTKAAKA